MTHHIAGNQLTAAQINALPLFVEMALENPNVMRLCAGNSAVYNPETGVLTVEENTAGVAALYGSLNGLPRILTL